MTTLLSMDEYGNPAVMGQVETQGRSQEARIVYIPVGGRYGLDGKLRAKDAMVEIQPWATKDGGWRGAGFRWGVDTLNGRDGWSRGCALDRGLLVHGGSTYDPSISMGGGWLRLAFAAFGLDTNPNQERDAR